MSSTTRKPVSLWQSHVKTTCTAVDLSVDVRRVLGILFSGRDCSSVDISAASGISNDDVVYIIREIKVSRHPIITAALQFGLPLDARVSLPESGKLVICKRCGQVLSVVPCCKCQIRHAINNPSREDRVHSSRDLPQPPKPTKFPPGSISKIDVMRWRAENGYCVFHKRDVKSYAEWLNQKQRRKRNQVLKGKIYNGCRTLSRTV